MCYHPVTIKINQTEIDRYYPEYKDLPYYKISQEMTPELYRKVPCRICLECEASDKNQKAFRAKQELKYSEQKGYSIRLSYRDSELPTIKQKHFFDYTKGQTVTKKKTVPGTWIYKDVHVLDKVHIQNFIKRFKNYQREETKQKYPHLSQKERNKKDILKYVISGEYSPTKLRPHYHMALIGATQRTIDKIFECNHTGRQTTIQSDIWKYGEVHIEPLDNYTILYAVKYIGKQSMPKGLETQHQPFTTMSNKLGSAYIEDTQMKNYLQNHQKHQVWNGKGFQPMPKIYREKLFTKEENKKINQQTEIERNDKINKEMIKYNISEQTVTKRKEETALRKYHKKMRQHSMKIPYK